MAVDDQIRRVGQISLLHQPIAGVEADALAHEGQELQLCGLDLGKHRYSPKHLEFLLEAHIALLEVGAVLLQPSSMLVEFVQIGRFDC